MSENFEGRKVVVAGGGGAIVNIGSMWAHQGIAATPPGIRVNAVAR
jgi:hypothetical protein